MLSNLDFLKQITEELLSNLGFMATVTVVEDLDSLAVTIEGDNLGILIGYHGETLLALQTWLSQALYVQTNEWLPVSLDISGYAAERKAKLRDLAVNAMDRARFLAKAIDLPPMPAAERRIVHTVVAETPGMKSESLGEGLERHVVVSAS